MPVVVLSFIEIFAEGLHYVLVRSALAWCAGVSEGNQMLLILVRTTSYTFIILDLRMLTSVEYSEMAVMKTWLD